MMGRRVLYCGRRKWKWVDNIVKECQAAVRRQQCGSASWTWCPRPRWGGTWTWSRWQRLRECATPATIYIFVMYVAEKQWWWREETHWPGTQTIFEHECKLYTTTADRISWWWRDWWHDRVMILMEVKNTDIVPGVEVKEDARPVQLPGHCHQHNLIF